MDKDNIPDDFKRLLMTITGQIEPLKQKIAMLEARVAALESRPPSPSNNKE